MKTKNILGGLALAVLANGCNPYGEITKNKIQSAQEQTNTLNWEHNTSDKNSLKIPEYKKIGNIEEKTVYGKKEKMYFQKIEFTNPSDSLNKEFLEFITYDYNKQNKKELEKTGKISSPEYVITKVKIPKEFGLKDNSLDNLEIIPYNECTDFGKDESLSRTITEDQPSTAIKIRNLFEEEFYSPKVSFAEEGRYGKTDFYFIPKDKSKIRINRCGNVTVNTENEIYRGIKKGTNTDSKENPRLAQLYFESW